MFADAATVGLLFFLGFIGLGVAILAVLRYWLVDNTLETGSAVGLLGVLLIGSAMVVRSGSPALMLLWIILLIGGSLGVPALGAFYERRELHESYEETIAKYKNAIARDTTNSAAWREMGELYLKMDRYDEAIAAYKEAIRLNPHDVDKIRRRLNQALDYRAGLPTVNTVVCEQCQSETPSGKPCLYCGASQETNFLEWLLNAAKPGEALQPLAAIIAGIIALLTVFTTLPVGIKAVIIALCMAAGGFLIWRMTRSGD